MDKQAKSQVRGRKRVGVAALAVLLASSGASTARAQLIDRLVLPPVPVVHDLTVLLNAILVCVPDALTCGSGFDCCDPCAAQTDGAYCGSELFPPGDPSGRYFCREGQTIGTAFCSQGCLAGQCVDPGGGGPNPD